MCRETTLVLALLSHALLLGASCRDQVAALGRAVVANDVARTTELIEDGVDVDAVSPDEATGFTPFVYAASTGRVEIVEVFLRHGVRVNARRGWFATTALIEAAMHGQIAVARRLVEVPGIDLEV